MSSEKPAVTVQDSDFDAIVAMRESPPAPTKAAIAANDMLRGMREDLNRFAVAALSVSHTTRRQSVTASCGHAVNGLSDLTEVRIRSQTGDSLNGLIRSVTSGMYCPACTKASLTWTERIASDKEMEYRE